MSRTEAKPRARKDKLTMRYTYLRCASPPLDTVDRYKYNIILIIYGSQIIIYIYVGRYYLRYLAFVKPGGYKGGTRAGQDEAVAGSSRQVP